MVVRCEANPHKMQRELPGPVDFLARILLSSFIRPPGETAPGTIDHFRSTASGSTRPSVSSGISSPIAGGVFPDPGELNHGRATSIATTTITGSSSTSPAGDWLEETNLAGSNRGSLRMALHSFSSAGARFARGLESPRDSGTDRCFWGSGVLGFWGSGVLVPLSGLTLNALTFASRQKRPKRQARRRNTWLGVQKPWLSPQSFADQPFTLPREPLLTGLI